MDPTRPPKSSLSRRIQEKKLGCGISLSTKRVVVGGKDESYNMFVEIVGNEDNFNMKLLGEVVWGGEFDDVLIGEGDEGGR